MRCFPRSFDEALELGDFGPERDKLVVQPQRLPTFGASVSPQRYEMKRHSPSLSARLSRMPHIQAKSNAKRGSEMRKMLILAAVASAALALAATAVAAAGWTPTQATAKVKTTYTTIDQKTYDWAKEHDYASAMARALHGAKPTSVSCKGAGRPTAGRYSRFHCTAQVKSVLAPIPPDYVLYTATKKLTVTVAGRRWRILNGWR